jgi:hypothetical protein
MAIWSPGMGALNAASHESSEAHPPKTGGRAGAYMTDDNRQIRQTLRESLCSNFKNHVASHRDDLITFQNLTPN